MIERQGRAITNFEHSLPRPDSDLARESLKDPYRLDFLGLGEEAQEREIESALVQHVTDFLLELGAGFAFVGRQVQLEIGGDDFFLDLLFYHLKLRRYVVIELKADRFKPEHLGQLGFYLTAVDELVKDPIDGPPSGCCCARAGMRSLPSTPCATTPSHSASPSTSSLSPSPIRCRRPCRPLSRSNANSATERSEHAPSGGTATRWLGFGLDLGTPTDGQFDRFRPAATALGVHRDDRLAVSCRRGNAKVPAA